MKKKKKKKFLVILKEMKLFQIPAFQFVPFLAVFFEGKEPKETVTDPSYPSLSTCELQL